MTEHTKRLEVVWTADGNKFGITLTMPDGSRITQYFEASADLACLLASAVPA